MPGFDVHGLAMQDGLNCQEGICRDAVFQDSDDEARRGVWQHHACALEDGGEMLSLLLAQDAHLGFYGLRWPIGIGGVDGAVGRGQ